MKQELLNSVVGLTVEDAEERVIASGHETLVVPEDVDALTDIARPNTVILWEVADIIYLAEAGDLAELEGWDGKI